MIGYVMLGTNDLARGARFYDALLRGPGAKRVMENERRIAWSKSPDAPKFLLIKPADGNAATVGNGTMVSITCESRDKVDALHAKALALGATDEGAPALHGAEGKYYGGYFRDLDGNKLVFDKMDWKLSCACRRAPCDIDRQTLDDFNQKLGRIASGEG